MCLRGFVYFVAILLHASRLFIDISLVVQIAHLSHGIAAETTWLCVSVAISALSIAFVSHTHITRGTAPHTRACVVLYKVAATVDFVVMPLCGSEGFERLWVARMILNVALVPTLELIAADVHTDSLLVETLFPMQESLRIAKLQAFVDQWNESERGIVDDDDDDGAATPEVELFEEPSTSVSMVKLSTNSKKLAAKES